MRIVILVLLYKIEVKKVLQSQNERTKDFFPKVS